MEIPIWFHEDGVGGSGDSLQLLGAFNLVWGGNEETTRMDLCGFSNLEGEAIFWDINFEDFSISGVGEETSIWVRNLDLGGVLIKEEGGSESGETSVIVVPAAPVSLAFFDGLNLLGFWDGIIMEESGLVGSALTDNLFKDSSYS